MIACSVLIASYELMLKCWSLDPDERPTPIDLVATLTPLDQPCLQESSDLNEVDEKDTKSNGVKENGSHPTSKQDIYSLN